MRRLRDVRKRLDFTNSLLLRLAAKSDAVHAYLPTDTLCGEQLCSLFLNGVFLYHDDDHLNATGSMQFAKQLRALIRYLLISGTRR